MSSNTEIPPSTPDDLAETADLIKGLNRRVVTAEVDVRDYQALKTAVDGGVEQLGAVGHHLANAGIGNGGQTLDKTSEDEWRDIPTTSRSRRSSCMSSPSGGRAGGHQQRVAVLGF